MDGGAGAGPERVESNLIRFQTMYESDSHDKERIAVDHPDRRDPAAAEADAAPDDPNPEHPTHYYAEAHRTYKRLKSGEWTGDDLGARKWGLLAYWYPDVVAPTGGDPS
jgi:hypothetical protein